MHKLTLFLLAFLLFSACNNDQKQVDQLLKETETIHDQAMKEMADMNRVARALKESMVATTLTPEQSAEYNTVLTNIGKAENGMMDWMKNYKSLDEMSQENALEYIQGQKTGIEKNYADIKAALEAGKKLQGQ